MLSTLTRQTGIYAFVLLWLTTFAYGAKPVNYDESQVPAYTLPNPLVKPDGTAVTDAQVWFEQRRLEILGQFQSQMYGKTPDFAAGLVFELVAEDRDAVGGTAIRRTVRITTMHQEQQHSFDLVIYLPKAGPRPLPTFVGILLFPKEAADPSPGVPLELTAAEQQQLNLEAPLPGKDLLKTILDRHYAVASIDAEEIAPDDPKRYREGIIRLYSGAKEADRQPDEWGALGAWAWALSRAMDYFESTREFDAKRIGAIGHSRRGKTALWAGAQDPRFSLVISNDSGCGGAALSRRHFGETVKQINDRFPHWFCLNFRQYNEREAELPFDQHELLGLIAPRPVYVGSAVDDAWADPRGEFLSCVHADPVYQLLKIPGLGVTEMPPPNHSIGKTIGYHIRVGKHALTDFDWLKYLDFADRHWKFVRASTTGEI